MKEPVKITKKIVGYKVVTEEGVTKIPDEQGVTYINPTDTLVAQLEELAELETAKDIAFKTAEAINLVIKPALKRPLRLDNEWRLKPPYANHALYVRLNAITHEGKKYPYEIFFNTKEVKDIKWLNALTVTISTAFRTAIETGTSLQPLIDNFKESCDTESPYLSRVPEKPKFVNGLVAEIGLVIEEFNRECLAWNYENYKFQGETAKGAYEALRELDKEAFEMSHEIPATEEEKQAAVHIKSTFNTKDIDWEDVGKLSSGVLTIRVSEDSKSSEEDMCYVEPEPEGFPPNATICTTCGIKAVVILDGCKTCLDCGDSKCG